MRDNERLLTIIGEVDEQLIWEAEHLKPEAPKPVWFRQPWLRAAAALVLVIAIGLIILYNGLSNLLIHLGYRKMNH